MGKIVIISSDSANEELGALLLNSGILSTAVCLHVPPDLLCRIFPYPHTLPPLTHPSTVHKMLCSDALFCRPVQILPESIDIELLHWADLSGIIGAIYWTYLVCSNIEFVSTGHITIPLLDYSCKQLPLKFHLFQMKHRMWNCVTRLDTRYKETCQQLV